LEDPSEKLTLSAVSQLVRYGLAIIGLGIALAVGWNAARRRSSALSGSWSGSP
jgi:hypothetical protein